MSKQSIEATREKLINQARTIRDTKDAEAKKKFDEILAKAQAIYDRQIKSAQEKYDDFVSKVEEDTGKRLKIVNKVIDAEAEERLFKEEQIRKQKESAEREEAEQKMRDEAERQRKEQEEKEKRIAAKKAAKEKKKQMALRAKVPIPEGFVACANSKKLYGKLKKINSAGVGIFVFVVSSHSKYLMFRTLWILLFFYGQREKISLILRGIE